MKQIIYLSIFFLFACGNKIYKPAEDALDAAREFKDGCLKGNFDKAKYYLFPSKKNETKLNKLQDGYFKQSSKEIKQSQEASIIIKYNKQLSASKTQIIFSNSFNSIEDTLFVIYKNNIWQVDLN